MESGISQASFFPSLVRNCAFTGTLFYLANRNMMIGKGKVHPRTGHEGPESSRGIVLLFLNLGARCGGWSTPRPCCFTPDKVPLPIIKEAGWASGTVWTGAENLGPHRHSIPRLFSPWRVAMPNELFRFLFRMMMVSYSYFFPVNIAR